MAIAQKKKAAKSKEKREQQLFAKLTSKELAVKNNNSLTSIATIKAELTGKLVKRLHLYPLLLLPETNQFQYKLSRNMQLIASGTNGKSSEDLG